MAHSGTTYLSDIERRPEVTVGIFSHIRPAAKKFLRQIKDTFERHDYLKTLYHGRSLAGAAAAVAEMGGG